MVYGTEGAIAPLGLVVLADTKGAQIVYEPAPTIRADVLDSHPEIREILEPVFASLDLETLQTLNAKIAVDGEDPRQVAAAYLKSQRSEARRVGKECVSTCRSRGAPYH